MENASKALIIAGAILISILIIAIGMYIYTSSTGAITDSIAQMDTQAITAFNSQWSNYEGTQTGSQIKSLIDLLIAQANTYQDEPEKVVAVYCEPTESGSTNAKSFGYQFDNGTLLANSTLGAGIAATKETDLKDYITQLNNLSSTIKPKHKYEVTLDKDSTPLIRRIIIKY